MYYHTTDPQKKRAAWVVQLQVVVELLNEVAIISAWDESLVLPLRDLYLALLSLDDGTTEPPLKARKVRGTTPSMKSTMFRAHAAGASAVLMRCGWLENVADAWVATRLDALGYKKAPISRDRKITAGTIRGWRKEARENLDGPMREMYDQWLDVVTISTNDPRDPEFTAACEDMIEVFRRNFYTTKINALEEK
jgi:hypothetical protein